MEAELHNTRSRCRLNLSDIGIQQIGDRIIEVPVVKGVEQFGAQLDLVFFIDRKEPEERNIGVRKPRSGEKIPLNSSNLAGSKPLGSAGQTTIITRIGRRARAFKR